MTSVRARRGRAPHRRHGARIGPRALLAVAASLLLAGLVACGGGPSTSVTISMLDNSYPRELTRIGVGDTVRFANDGDTVHNAVAADGSWSTAAITGDEAMRPGESASLTFDEPGVYEFHCTFHATRTAEGDWEGMVGTLVVGEDAQAVDDGEDPEARVVAWSGTTRHVPRDHPTIQNAVDAAAPGDLVLVDSGVYREQVDVTTPSITIRGVDRQDTVIDGEFTRPNGINVVGADGVAVENLTVRHATVNGVFFTGVTGYRASWVSALNNGVYGIYAFDSVDGVFEHDYAAGSPDSGLYIGQCNPCRGIIDDSVAEWNGLGYSGTNASGVVIVDSTWRHNVAGIVPNTLDTELLPPFEDVTIVGNLVHDNDNRDAPTLSAAWGSFGAGITLAGGNDSLVARNLVVNHERAGVLVAPNLSRRFWMSGGNEVRDNVIRGSGLADIVFAGPATGGNCFSGNDLSTTVVPGLQVLHSCTGPRLPAGHAVGPLAVALGPVAESAEAEASRADSYRTAPTPAADAQPDMPADTPVVPAHDVFAGRAPDVAAVTTPTMPDDLTVTRTKEPTMAGIPLLGSAVSVFYGLYAWFLPFALYATWMGLAAWDLSRRDDLGTGGRVGWLAVVLLVPFLGPVAYHLAGGSPIPAHVRWTVVVGGIAAYAATFAVGALVGGIV